MTDDNNSPPAQPAFVGKPKDPMLKMSSVKADGRPMVTGYGSEGFRVGETWHTGPIVLTPEGTAVWTGPEFDDLTQEDFSVFISHDPGLDILLLGCGPAFHMVDADLKAALRAQGLSLDPMDTAAAARTFNVLVAEERRVAALLFPTG